MNKNLKNRARDKKKKLWRIMRDYRTATAVMAAAVAVVDTWVE